MTGVVSRVDHVVIEAGGEQAVFDFFHATLGLPVAWPMAQWGMIHEGGINVGNCNIGCNHKLDPNSPDEPRIAAVAFEPQGGIESALRELDARGLAHSDALPSGEIDVPFEPWNAGFTNALIFNPTPLSFICEYHHDTAQRRRAQEEAFAAHPNPLGITGVEGVWCNTTQVNAWDVFFSDGPPDGPWIAWDDSIGAGSPSDEWWDLMFRVDSLEKAATAARRVGLSYGEERGGRVTVGSIRHPLGFISLVDNSFWP
jgi:hypothetical protein